MCKFMESEGAIVKENEEQKSHFYIVRVTVGRESQAMERLDSKIAEAPGVYSIMKPHSFRGYIIIEADNIDSVQKLIYGIRYLRGILKKEISLNDILNIIKKKKEETVINIGDIVKVLAGPFKGENATVKSVNKDKGEVSVMFLDSAVPISVAINISDVEVIKGGDQNENKS